MSIRVVERNTVYRQKGWYAGHPSLVQTTNGDLLAFFRRCPDHLARNHHHPLFDMRACRSTDGGHTWGPQGW